MNDIKLQIKTWVMDKKKLSAEQLDFDTPLLEEKILKSIDIMDLILFIEFMREEPININELNPGVFHSIDTITANFFPQ